MKFERWDKDRKEFVKIDMSEDDYLELLEQFDYMDAEMQIEERIEMLKFRHNHSVDQFWTTEPVNIPKYD